MIHADKNSNTAGVKSLAPNAKPWSEFVSAAQSGSIRHAIALGADVSVAKDSDALGKIEALVVIASHESPLTNAATVVLPATSWAEQTGTYVNAKNLKQVSDKAIQPQGASKQALVQLADVAKALGLEPTWAKLKDVRSKLEVSEPQDPGVLPTTSTQAV